MTSPNVPTAADRAALAVSAQLSNLARALGRLPRGTVAAIDGTGYALARNGAVINIDLCALLAVSPLDCEPPPGAVGNHERAEEIERWLALPPPCRPMYQY